MVLQDMFLALCGFAPERSHDDTWLCPTTNGSTSKDGEQAFPSSAATIAGIPAMR
jgi:hypothetical protein